MGLRRKYGRPFHGEQKNFRRLWIMAGLVQKFKNMWNPPDDEYDYDYDYDEAVQEEEKSLEHEARSRATAFAVRRPVLPAIKWSISTQPLSFRWYSLSRSIMGKKCAPLRTSF